MPMSPSRDIKAYSGDYLCYQAKGAEGCVPCEFYMAYGFA